MPITPRSPHTISEGQSFSDFDPEGNGVRGVLNRHDQEITDLQADHVGESDIEGIVTEGGTQTLTNKTIDGDSNTLMDISASAKKSSGATVYKSSNQSLTSGTITAISFNAELNDTSSYHDNSANNTRLTVPSTGNYIITYNLVMAANGTGDRFGWVRINGDTTDRFGIQGGIASSTNDACMSGCCRLPLTEGDYIELVGFQSSGGALNVLGDAAQGRTILGIELMGI